ncbi:hypothetical protein Pla163_26860 [Planctomycetes bacterium Pla163]|uniref:Uncharacterized protein n=1 Tax=Rohdeia mirabilis TaxID=2528008 RepID=A0A518D253_9BACT|nr:hypothetical protein Pla163_26860 [Planctomycetes bacterium Pla163]
MTGAGRDDGAGPELGRELGVGRALGVGRETGAGRAAGAGRGLGAGRALGAGRELGAGRALGAGREVGRELWASAVGAAGIRNARSASRVRTMRMGYLRGGAMNHPTVQGPFQGLREGEAGSSSRTVLGGGQDANGLARRPPLDAST